MAEIGTVAAAAQLAGYGVKAVIVCARLYQQLHDAPQKVQCKRSNIHHAEALIKIIRSDFDSAGSGNVSGLISPAALKEANDLVQAWLIRAEYLSALLDGLAPAPKDTTLKKGLKRARTLRLEQVVDSQFEELDKLARTLDLWYSHQNMRLWQQQMISSSFTQASLQTLQKQVEECNVSIQGMVQNLPQIHRRKRQRKQRKPCPTTAASRSVNPIPQLARGQCHIDAPISRVSDLLDKCSCFRASAGTATKRDFIVGPLTFFYQSDAHGGNCPFRTAPVTRKYGATAKLRFSTGLNITMAFQSISGGPVLQLSPQIVATRIVDRKASPAFLALTQMGGALCNATGKSCTGESWWLSSLACQQPDQQLSEHIRSVRAVLRNVHRKLEYNFRVGLASARDEDENGSTLLHCDTFRPPGTYKPKYGIVTLLIEHGIEVNARTLHRPMKTCTALDICFFDAAGTDGFKSCHMLSLSKIDRLISNHGGEITRSKLGAGFPCEMRVILNNPDIGVEYRCSPLSLAVIRRDFSTIKQLVIQKVNFDGKPDDPHSPLSFALGWPEGMRFLLESGADPSTAIHSAVFFGDETAVQILLEYDCRIFRDCSMQYPPQSAWNSPFEGDSRKAPVDSVLEYSLWKYVYANDSNRCPNNSNMPSIRRAIVDYIAKSRRRLAELALSKIPLEKLCRLGWNGSEDTIIDTAAVPICQALEQLGVEVPRSLRPGRYRTVYHMRYLDTSTAECLYKAGFHDLDVEDDEGWTPLLLSCSGLRHMESLDSSDPLPSWYLDRDVLPRATAASKGTTQLHLLAKRFWHYLRYYEPSHEKCLQMSGIMSRFASSINLTCTDECDCFCSNTGCLPSTVFLKDQHIRKSQSNPLYWDLKHLHLRQALLDSARPEQIQELHASAARLEMFERLGISHTCCPSAFPWKARSDADDRETIWEEETLLIQHLRDWMDIYHELNGEYADDFFIFWEAWWKALEKFMPERPWSRSSSRGGKSYWAQELDYDHPGIGEYGPDKIAVRIEVDSAIRQLQKRQGEWSELVMIGCGVFV